MYHCCSHLNTSFERLYYTQIAVTCNEYPQYLNENTIVRPWLQLHQELKSLWFGQPLNQIEMESFWFGQPDKIEELMNWAPGWVEEYKIWATRLRWRDLDNQTVIKSQIFMVLVLALCTGGHSTESTPIIGFLFH